jgi:hypothetical protein
VRTPPAAAMPRRSPAAGAAEPRPRPSDPPNAAATGATRTGHGRRRPKRRLPPPPSMSRAPRSDRGGAGSEGPNCHRRQGRRRTSEPPGRPHPPLNAGEEGEKEPRRHLHYGRTSCRRAARAAERREAAGGGLTVARVGAARSPSRRRPERPLGNSLND